MRVMPSVGSGRYSPDPGLGKLPEVMILPGITHGYGDLFTNSARYPCHRFFYFADFFLDTGFNWLEDVSYSGVQYLIIVRMLHA